MAHASIPFVGISFLFTALVVAAATPSAERKALETTTTTRPHHPHLDQKKWQSAAAGATSTEMDWTTEVPQPSIENSKQSPQYYQTGFRWPGHGQNIPYDMTTPISNGGATFSDSFRSLIRSAFAHISAHTCLTFQEVSGPSVPTKRIWLAPSNSGRCYSAVGFDLLDPSPMRINLDPSVCNQRGTIIHEIGHTLGLLHMHSRPDRDHYIVVDTSKAILSGLGQNFVAGWAAPSDCVLPYDYGSIMQYPKTTDSASGGIVTMYAPQPIGQNWGLSAQDIAELQFMYSECLPDKVVCVHTAVADATLAFGETYILNFTMNAGDHLAASLFSVNVTCSDPTLVSLNVSIVYPASLTMPAVMRLMVIVTPTIPVTSPKQVVVSAQFIIPTEANQSSNNSSISEGTSCSATLWVVPFPSLVNCFGRLATDPTVCSGHGRCALTDLCICNGSYVGLVCQMQAAQTTMFTTFGSAQYYNGLAFLPTDSTRQWTNMNNNNGSSNSTGEGVDVWEDYQMDFVEENVASFELQAVVLTLAVGTTSAVTLSFYAPDGSAFDDGFPMVSSSIWVQGRTSLTTADPLEMFWTTCPLTGVLPKSGKLRVRTTAKTYLGHGSSAFLLKGIDNPNFGTFATMHPGDRLYFALNGFLRCKDGFYGSKCQFACAGVRASASGGGGSLFQCHGNGLCSDGTEGTGQCITCFAGIPANNCFNGSTSSDTPTPTATSNPIFVGTGAFNTQQTNTVNNSTQADNGGGGNGGGSNYFEMVLTVSLVLGLVVAIVLVVLLTWLVRTIIQRHASGDGWNLRSKIMRRVGQPYLVQHVLASQPQTQQPIAYTRARCDSQSEEARSRRSSCSTASTVALGSIAISVATTSRNSSSSDVAECGAEATTSTQERVGCGDGRTHGSLENVGGGGPTCSRAPFPPHLPPRPLPTPSGSTSILRMLGGQNNTPMAAAAVVEGTPAIAAATPVTAFAPELRRNSSSLSDTTLRPLRGEAWV